MAVKVHVRKSRKVLVASLGVASVSFVGVGCLSTSVANLPAPPSCDIQPQNPYCVGKKNSDAGAPDGGGDADDGSAHE